MSRAESQTGAVCDSACLRPTSRKSGLAALHAGRERRCVSDDGGDFIHPAARERWPSCLSPYRRGAGPPPPAKGGSGLRGHSPPLPPLNPPALPLIGTSSAPPRLHAPPSTPRPYPPCAPPSSPADGVAGPAPALPAAGLNPRRAHIPVSTCFLITPLRNSVSPGPPTPTGAGLDDAE